MTGAQGSRAAPAPEGDERRRRRAWFVCLAFPLVLAATLALLWPAITGPFVFDDFPNLENLGRLGGEFTRESIGRYLAAWQGNPGRPLAALSFLIEDNAWPTDPLPYKRNNLLLHLLVGIGVFALVRKLAGLAGVQSWHRDGVALLATAYWLLHPFQLSTTMLVVQRMTVLSSGLMVVGLLLYLRLLATDRQATTARALGALAALGASGVLACLAKENGALVFAYAAALNCTLLGPALRRFERPARTLLCAGTAGATAAIVLALFWMLPSLASGYMIRDFDVMERLLTQARVLWSYLHGILLPSLSGTGIYHDDLVVSRGLLEPWTTLPALLGLLATVAVAFAVRRRWPLAAFAVLWFVAGHLIESTILPLELYFEHRNYLPMVGPIVALVIGAAKAPTVLQKWLLVVAALWILLAGAISHQSAKVWGNEAVLAEIWVNEQPGSVRAWQLLGSYYANRGDFITAYTVFHNAIDQVPEGSELRMQLVYLDCMSGRAGSDVAQRLPEMAAEVRYAAIVPNLVSGLREWIGRCEGFDLEAFASTVAALQANPAYVRHVPVLAFLEYELARAYASHGRFDQALVHLERSYEAKADPEVALQSAHVLLMLGRPADALQRIELTDSTPQPAFKRWLYDRTTASAQLRELAHRMLADRPSP